MGMGSRATRLIGGLRAQSQSLTSSPLLSGDSRLLWSPAMPTHQPQKWAEAWWASLQKHPWGSTCGTKGGLLTMLLFLKMLQLIGTREDVGLTSQAVPKGVLPARHDIVTDTASREDVHCLGLHKRKRTVVGGRPAYASWFLPPAPCTRAAYATHYFYSFLSPFGSHHPKRCADPHSQDSP